MSDRTFLDVVGDEAPLPVPMPPRKPSVLAYGTDVDDEWDEAWIELVREVEKETGTAVCGARRTETDIDALVRSEKIRDEDVEVPKTWVCSLKAGLETQHPGQGRCYRHGGNTAPMSRFALISDPELGARVHDYFEQEKLLDLRGAIATIWVAANTFTDAGELSANDAKELGALMTRIGNLTKQHNEIMEKRKIQIEVPEFIAWAEHFYELAIKYILDGDKDVQGFLTEAKSYYDATVTIKVGLDAAGDSDRASHPFGGDST